MSLHLDQQCQRAQTTGALASPLCGRVTVAPGYLVTALLRTPWPFPAGVRRCGDTHLGGVVGDVKPFFEVFLTIVEKIVPAPGFTHCGSCSGEREPIPLRRSHPLRCPAVSAPHPPLAAGPAGPNHSGASIRVRRRRYSPASPPLRLRSGPSGISPDRRSRRSRPGGPPPSRAGAGSVAGSSATARR